MVDINNGVYDYKKAVKDDRRMLKQTEINLINKLWKNKKACYPDSVYNKYLSGTYEIAGKYIDCKIVTNTVSVYIYLGDYELPFEEQKENRCAVEIIERVIKLPSNKERYVVAVDTNELNGFIKEYKGETYIITYNNGKKIGLNAVYLRDCLKIVNGFIEITAPDEPIIIRGTEKIAVLYPIRLPKNKR